MKNGVANAAGPDFLCIGMQKAGTRWLYDSLDSCHGFWMPPIKELHFFDRGFLEEDLRLNVDAQNLRWCRRLLAGQPTKMSLGRSLRRLEYDPVNDREFSERWIRMADNGYRLDDYVALFESKESSLSGDITPAYSALSEEDVRSVRSALPGLKVILLVRDPVARAWSSFNMHIRRRLMSRDDRKKSEAASVVQRKATLDELNNYMNLHESRQRSFPSVSYDRWTSVFGEARVHVTFFQDIVSTPASVIADICKFLNVALESPPIPALNAKAEAPRATMSDGHKAFLNDYFRDEYRALRELFPERASEWAPQ